MAGNSREKLLQVYIQHLIYKIRYASLVFLGYLQKMIAYLVLIGCRQFPDPGYFGDRLYRLRAGRKIYLNYQAAR